MNKKLLTLLALLVAMTSLFAVYVEIGDGTETTNYLPFYGFYDYSWSNYILTSEQIGDAIDINEIQFNVGNTPSNYAMENQQVYMKLTTETEVTVAYPDPANNDFTLVFDGSVTWNEGGWQGVIFDTNFAYDGTSNLQIVWINNDSTYASGYPNFLKTTTEINTAAYKYADNTFPVTDGTLQTNFPNTRLGYAVEGAPGYPTLVSPENNSLNNELDTELVWTNGENTDFVDVYFSMTEADVVNNEESALVVDGQLVTSFAPTLENASVYYWKVVAANANSEITAETNVFAFSTTYGIAEVPYFEGFENVTTPALPLGWMSYNEGSSSYSDVETYGGQAYEGTNSFKIANSSDAEGTYIAVLPQIENMGNRMKFWAKCSSAGSQVIVGYLSDVADPASFTEIQTIDMTSDYAEHIVELELPRTVRYLAFKHANVGTYQTIYIDNVEIEEIPENEPTPATLLTPANAATDVALNAELTWEYGMNTVAVNLYLSDDMAEVTDLAAEAMVVENQDITSYTTDLAEWTTYYWRVGSLNSTGYEVLSAINSFTTIVPDGTIIIGEGDATNQGMPIEPYYGYTYTQTIYTQADIDMTGDIQTIAWHYNGNSAWGPDDIKIYMAHTDLEAFDGTEAWVAAENLTLVYDGTFSVPAVDGWVPVNLDTPFNYNNTQNLLIAVEENTQGYHSSSDEFFNTETTANVSITYRNDTNNPDPLDPPEGTLKTYYPNLVLVMEEGETPIVYPAPTNLTAEVQDENDIHLAWNMPILPEEEGEWLWHGSGVYDDGFGTGTAFTYTGVVRYDASDLENYSGASLTQVKFYPRNAQATYTLKVWTGGSYDGTDFLPGTEVHSQAIDTFETFSWNFVELTSSITLAAGQELWVGIETVTPNGYPLGVDAGPAVVGKGDLVFFNGAWNLISNFNNDKNFLIQAYVEGARISYRDPLEITAYNIYRNNTVIQSIADANDTTWVDLDVPNGYYEYKVTALYDTEMSEPSNVVVVDTTPPVYNPPTNFTAVIVDENDVQINWEAPLDRNRVSARRQITFGTENQRLVTRELTGYTLYRDNTIIAEVATDVMSYLDEDLDFGTYQYKAVANYDEADSDPTPVVTVVIEEIEEILPPENLTASVDEDLVTLNWDAPGMTRDSRFLKGLSISSKALPKAQVRENRDLTAYKVYRDDAVIATLAADVYTYEDADLENGDYEYYVTAMYDTEESVASNTVSVTVNVTGPVDYLIEDDFETYPDFALEAGPWTLVDGDLSPTYGFQGVSFENSGSPMSYIVFNPASTTPPLEEDANAAHSGTKYMACFASTTPINNDWMITPEFTLGDSGTFSFWGKSVMDDYGLERFNVLVSNGSTNPNDFTSISGASYTQAPITWTQYSYSLDDYANQNIRIAIQCVSDDAFIFMVDQVQIEAPGGTSNQPEIAPLVSQLIGNYPNPFNPETRIAFSTVENGPVAIDIYNVKGQKVRTLLNENREAGNHSVVWNGKDDNGKNVASGVFFYRMKSGKYSSTKKMILMK